MTTGFWRYTFIFIFSDNERMSNLVTKYSQCCFVMIINITSPPKKTTDNSFESSTGLSPGNAQNISVITRSMTTIITTSATVCEYTFLHKSLWTVDQAGYHRWYNNQATGWKTKGSWVNSQQEQRSSEIWRDKWPQLESDHPPTLNTDVKNEYSYTSNSFCTFIAWWLIKHN